MVTKPKPRGEHVLQLILGGVEGKISYKQFRIH